MKDINAYRLFEEGRLHPWKPDNKVIIDAHLAMLSVTNPSVASSLAAHYTKKLDAYLASKEVPKKVPVQDVSEPEADIPEIVVQKKRGRKSSPLSK